MGKILLAIILMTAIVYFALQMVKCMINIWYYNKHKDDVLAPRKLGMAFNKKTNKLEYSEELILPFE